MTDMNEQTFTLINSNLTKLHDSVGKLHDRITKVDDAMDVRMVRQEVWRNRAIGFMGAITLVMLPIVGWIIRFEYMN